MPLLQAKQGLTIVLAGCFLLLLADIYFASEPFQSLTPRVVVDGRDPNTSPTNNTYMTPNDTSSPVGNDGTIVAKDKVRMKDKLYINRYHDIQHDGTSSMGAPKCTETALKAGWKDVATSKKCTAQGSSFFGQAKSQLDTSEKNMCINRAYFDAQWNDAFNRLMLPGSKKSTTIDTSACNVRLS